MSSLISGLSAGSSIRLDVPSRPAVEHVQRADQMRRLLAFAGRSIDDVVNCPVARREVISFFRIGRQMTRLAEVDALELQWNPLRTR
jgi:hypothetical protein